MQRRVTTQDISWFLDLDRNAQLNINPPYQRRSVWSPKDRQSFLDTIFRGYPCPAIFLHKETDEGGKQIYHVVDGKQRLDTILKFSRNEISIGKDFGDVELAGKKWKNLDKSPHWKKKFWDYVFSVEFIDVTDGIVINTVFDRLNRNARKLERQEIRHARFDGWFITTAENEAENEEWASWGISTKAKARRMKDVQSISELLILLMQGRIDGFDQDYIDEMYAEYDDISDNSSFAVEDFHIKLLDAKDYLCEIESSWSSITQYAKGFGDFYSLWAFVVLNRDKLPENPANLGKKYSDFMGKVETLRKEKEPETLYTLHTAEYMNAYTYMRNSMGASTDEPQRSTRNKALELELLIEQ
jgi:hypothetical protein